MVRLLQDNARFTERAVRLDPDHRDAPFFGRERKFLEEDVVAPLMLEREGVGDVAVASSGQDAEGCLALSDQACRTGTAPADVPDRAAANQVVQELRRLPCHHAGGTDERGGGNGERSFSPFQGYIGRRL